MMKRNRRSCRSRRRRSAGCGDGRGCLSAMALARQREAWRWCPLAPLPTARSCCRCGAGLFALALLVCLHHLVCLPASPATQECHMQLMSVACNCTRLPCKGAACHGLASSCNARPLHWVTNLCRQHCAQATSTFMRAAPLSVQNYRLNPRGPRPAWYHPVNLEEDERRWAQLPLLNVLAPTRPKT